MGLILSYDSRLLTKLSWSVSR